jgi:hypothetical protein
MYFADIEATCFAKGGKLENLVYKPIRTESGQRVWQTIDYTASNTPVAFIDGEHWHYIKTFMEQIL